ncbi:MAG: protein translocase subunit SecD [Victivallales bacterium]|nr:protein translocase subunit SecD [Victivallales bacterium]
MKKSLIIRWTVIAIVLIVWTAALFPLKDSDYLQMFRQVSATNVERIEAGAKSLLAKGDPAELQRKLEAATDKSTDEYKALNEKYEALRKDGDYANWRAWADYQELNTRLALIKHKSMYDRAEDIAKKQEAAPNDSLLKGQLAEVLNDPDYKAWMGTEEYQAFKARLPLVQKREKLELMSDKTSAEYKALTGEVEKLQAELAQVPQGDDPGKAKAYQDMMNRLSLVDHGERSISGFRALEKAANGNSDLYRISLNQFVNVPFHGKASNKLILRYIRVKSAGKLHLGLDLRGGTEFVLDFDVNEARNLVVTPKVVNEFLRVVIDGNEKYNKALPKKLADEIAAAVKLRKADNAALSNNDLALALAADATLGPAVRAFVADNLDLVKKDNANDYGTVIDIRDRILNILDNRLNSMGVTEPEIKATGENTISVRMPSVDEADKNEIRNTIRKAAKLQFFLVSTNNEELVQRYESDPQNFRTPAGVLRTEIETELADGSVRYEPVFLEAEPTAVSGEDVERAFPATNEFGQWRISLKFNGAGTVAFRNVTRANVGRRLAIVLDGKVYTAPNIREAIDGGQAEISGSFTLEEAKRLASVIASGNVPVTVNIGSEFGTDPTLGADSIRTGVFAALLGLTLVVLFMIWYYRVPGVIAVIALAVNTVLVLGTMAITKATITMPGIAGMVLTIGMAVDANVIIFERIREELNAGKVLANAVTGGYSKAFTSIFDSNITTLLTCFFLYKFGSGSVKGFAVTLAFGIMASMFTAIFMTRAIFETLVYGDVIKTVKMYLFPWFKKMDFDYLATTKVTVGISVVLVVASLLTMAIRGSGMLGIDFVGGTELSYSCAGEAPNVEAVRKFLQGEGVGDNIRVGYKRGQSGEPLLEIVISQGKAVSGQDEVKVDYTEFSAKLDKAFPQCKISLQQTNNVGANVGAQFRKAACLAAFFSVLGIIIYLAFRFEFMYGLGAAVAVVHDAIVSAGLFFMLGGNFSLTVLAAIMTIMGYSLNDTIVIFDRIRETRELRKELTYSQQINLAVNECMSRTMLTSVTTMIVVVAQLIFGGGAVFDFALVMFFGVIAGTYSTIFVACSFINHWHKDSAIANRAEEKFRQAQERAAREAAKAARPAKA